jgi:alkanesulfonate monooxygenase SsuD/methylene tetrahydromethanopterin reductase-like flavin-dependent oxidoreductase (luciferase family)
VGTPSPEKALVYPYTDFEKPHVLENRKRMIVGTPKKVRVQIEQLAEEFRADEVMLVMIAYDFQDKLKSYELIAKEMLK